MGANSFGVKVKFKNKTLQKFWNQSEKKGGGVLEKAITEYMKCVRDLILFGECYTYDRDVANMLNKQF